MVAFKHKSHHQVELLKYGIGRKIQFWSKSFFFFFFKVFSRIQPEWQLMGFPRKPPKCIYCFYTIFLSLISFILSFPSFSYYSLISLLRLQATICCWIFFINIMHFTFLVGWESMLVDERLSLWPIILTRLCESSTVMFFLVCNTVVFSPCLFSEDFYLQFCLKLVNCCSVGFRSGDWFR